MGVEPMCYNTLLVNSTSLVPQLFSQYEKGVANPIHC